MKYYVIILLLLSFFTQGQENDGFVQEVSAIQKKYDTLWDATKETIVFTGSSSIRFWGNLQEIFPQYQIVNSGFGGSQASDLLTYTSELVLQYQPKQVFIYEGDNDIAAGKKAKTIKTDILDIIAKIKNQNTATKIVLIAAKPSIARWELRKKYKRLNKKFKRLSNQTNGVYYADVWEPMIEGKEVRQDIFIADGLHMNGKGYALWFTAIKPFIEESN